MASSKGYLDYVLEQLPRNGVTFRAMMGEYILYYRGRPFGGVYDDRFLVKPVPAVQERMPDAPLETPYPGAKEMVLVTELDDRTFLSELLEAMYSELPGIKTRKG